MRSSRDLPRFEDMPRVGKVSVGQVRSVTAGKSLGSEVGHARQDGVTADPGPSEGGCVLRSSGR